MKDALVLASFEALSSEKLRLEALENVLRQEVHSRSLALKREETSNQIHLDRALVRIEMLKSEAACLHALLAGNKTEAERYREWCTQAVQNSRLMAKQRDIHNAWITQEIKRLGDQLGRLEQVGASEFEICTTDEAKDAVIQRNYAQIGAIRGKLARFASHCELVLRRLEDSAQAGRDGHASAMLNAADECRALSRQIVGIRREIRKRHKPAEANALIVWAESVGKLTRTRARWDLISPVCALDVVVLEAFRQRLADFAE